MALIPEINKDEVIENKEAVNEVEIELNEFTDSIIKIDNIDALEKNIKFIESMIRNSFEYRNYINYLKIGLNMNKCKFLPGLDANNIHIGLEMHHAPLTLYDIVEIIGKSFLEEGKETDYFEIEETVMAEHFKNNIGLVPLNATFHDLVHNEKLRLSPSKVYGNFTNFYRKYEKYFTDDQSAKFAEFLGTTDEEVEHQLDDISKEIKHYKIVKPKFSDDVIFD